MPVSGVDQAAVSQIDDATWPYSLQNTSNSSPESSHNDVPEASGSWVRIVHCVRYGLLDRLRIVPKEAILEAKPARFRPKSPPAKHEALQCLPPVGSPDPSLQS